MIKYVQNKPIDYGLIEKFLDRSVQAHTFTNGGPVKQLLEKKLAEIFKLDGDWRVVCTNNGTSALYVLISMYEKLSVGGLLQWATPAFNFPAATVNRLQTHIFDVELIETKTSIQYRIPMEKDKFLCDGNENGISCYTHNGFIIPTLFGTVPTNLEEIISWCKENNKVLILDNASSPLTHKNSQNINTFGSSSMGSLHHTKYLGMGEAGFVVVPSKYYDFYTQLTNFGFTDDRKYSNYATNSKISDISAAFVLSHLENYSVERHLKIQQKYIEALKNIKNIKLLSAPSDWSVVYGNMPICFNHPISHLSFRDIGIESNKYYKPLAPLKNSEALFSRIINLPLHVGLTDYDLDLILKKVETEAKK